LYNQADGARRAPDERGTVTTSKDCQSLRLEIIRADFQDSRFWLRDIFTAVRFEAEMLEQCLTVLGERIETHDA